MAPTTRRMVSKKWRKTIEEAGEGTQISCRCRGICTGCKCVKGGRVCSIYCHQGEPNGKCLNLEETRVSRGKVGNGPLHSDSSNETHSSDNDEIDDGDEIDDDDEIDDSPHHSDSALEDDSEKEGRRGDKGRKMGVRWKKEGGNLRRGDKKGKMRAHSEDDSEGDDSEEDDSEKEDKKPSRGGKMNDLPLGMSKQQVKCLLDVMGKISQMSISSNP